MADDEIWTSCPCLANSQSNSIYSICYIFSCEISIIFILCWSPQLCMQLCGFGQNSILDSRVFSLIPLDSLKCYLCENTAHTSQASSPPVLQKYAGLVHLLTNHQVLYVPIPFVFSLKECIDHILFFMLSAVYFKCLFSSVSVLLYFGLSSWVNLELREALLWSEMATGKYFSLCLMFCWFLLQLVVALKRNSVLKSVLKMDAAQNGWPTTQCPSEYLLACRTLELHRVLFLCHYRYETNNIRLIKHVLNIQKHETWTVY